MNSRKFVFEEQMAELYWLAFLITGDTGRSVQAFTDALQYDDDLPARKLIVLAAVSEVRPQLRESMLRTRAEDCGVSAELPRQVITRRDLERALLEMDVFPRCAFLLTVLEGWGLAETALVLGADEAEVKAGQIQGLVDLALRGLGSAALG